MFEQGASAREHTKVWYSGAARVALDAERLTAQKCEVCSYVLRRTYLCMQCPKVHCARDAEVHAREAQHTFGLRSPGFLGSGEAATDLRAAGNRC